MIGRLLKKANAKSYSYSFLGNLFSSVSQWVVLMLISKLYGTAQMGSYSLAMAWILPFYAFFSLQIRNIHVADQTDTYGFNVFFMVRVVCAIAFLLTTALTGFLFYRDIFMIFLLGGLFKAIEMMSDIIHAEFHKRKKIEVYSKMLMFRSVLAILLNLLMFRFVKSFQLALISLPIAYCCSMLIDFKLLSNLKVKIRFDAGNPLIKKIVTTGVLTGLSLLLVYLLPNIPRFVLEKYRNSFELGLFSGYLSLIVFSRIFVQSVVQNSLPYLAQHYDENNFDKFLSKLKIEALVIGGLGLAQFILVPLSNYLFPILFNKDFKGNEGLLCIIFAGSLFSFMAFVLNNAINAMKMFRVQLPVYAALVAISFVLGFLLIPKYGLNGAGMVFLLVNVCLCLMMGIIIYNRLHNRIKELSVMPKEVEVC
ncbi:lipopolysaccharide biosynthesis protein [Mucilaginibacter celer]|uniref:Lipopolysaccharide biosynthesis protein n=1 Tax=Mucilaginibacter celer TaxID=2305508 RepID=A0A494VS39_9SPHI|nr:lipopolysaccharide biosynthesis protein [Mucilaginibacter celer]AYL98427.1 lipopolysaccharide biosynthesis protein [Mucilaginibacter celer]